MRTLALLFFCGLTLTGTTFAAELEYEFLPGEMDFARVNPALQITKPLPDLTSITLTSPQVMRVDTLVDYERYDVFGIPGEPFDMEEGHPALPQITRMYRIPNTGSVELVLNEVEYHLVDDVMPFPVQWERGSFSKDLVRDPAAYQRDSWYPPAPAVVSAPMIFRDFRVVTVTLYPVQVNTATRQARIYDQLQVDIVPNEAPGENELLNPRRPSGAFAAMYRDHISNLDEDALDEVTDTPGHYLILCKDNATILAWADSLATWKHRKGYDVVIDARNNWNSNSMKQAIIDGYNNWDPPLEYACILGDVSGSFSMPTGPGGPGGQYDHYFGLIVGGENDDIEDVGIGRLSVQNTTHCATVFSKLFGYERTPYMADATWYDRAFLYAGIASNVRSNWLCMLWGRHQFHRFTGIDDVDVLTHQNQVNNGVIGAHLTEGVTFFLWRGTVVGEMDNSAATSMQSSFKLPVVLTITCGSGDFDDDTGLSEAWFRAGTASAPKGGICGIGTATYNTHVPYNNTVAGGLVYSICNLGVENVGLALASAKVQLHAAFPNNQQATNFSRWNNLMGEPSLSMWTETPVVLNVTYPATVNVGTRRVQPQVTNEVTGDPIEDALVTLWKGDETYARFLTDAGGFADIPVTVESEGTMWLTVSKRNHKPFLADITCVQAPRMVALATYDVDDDNAGGTQGNDDGEFNPGEIIDIAVTLSNYGTTLDGTNISASMTSNDARVTIQNGTQNFPDIAPGDSAAGLGSYRITISPLMVHDERAVITLAVTASGEQTHSAFEVRIKSGEASYVSSQISGGDGDARLEPNETANMNVTIRNDGELAMSAVSATLVSNSSFIAVIQNSSSFGTIPIGQTAVSATAFTLRANSLVYPGHQASLALFLTMSNGSVDTVTFAIPIGFIASIDPTGPDSYGYYAYDDTDDSVEFHHEFSYVDISTGGLGQDLNLNDPGEQMPQSGPFVAARELPFDFMFYGETYDSISICSNGWAAFGVQTDHDVFRNYQLPGQQAPDAMLSVFWDDLKTDAARGVWVYSDEANHRYIIQWKASGWFLNDANINQDFEIILLDPAFYPTRSGDGIIIYQYNDVTDMVGEGADISYCTIGIQNAGCTVGLQYRFGNAAMPGAASLVDHRAITITTESRAAFGHVMGQIIDAETLQPMENVLVTVDGQNNADYTDAQGNYVLQPDVLIGVYTLRASFFGYNDGVVENLVVEMDSTEVVDFNMVHPEIVLSTDSVIVHLPEDQPTTSFRMTNDGNGELDYQITIQFVAQPGPDEAWDHLTDINVTEQTSNYQIQGCEFIGDYWWVTGSSNNLYKFDLEGDLAGTVPQPSSTGFGWFDMAYDGTYLYGSDSPYIFGIDEAGTVMDTIDSPLNPTRAIAYDPQLDHFWVADFASDLYELSRSGQVIRQFSNPLKITGLAWNLSDPDGYKLYAFHQDENFQNMNVTRIHPISGDRQFVVQLDGAAGDKAGGATITPAWNSTLLVFAGIKQNSTGDRLGIWEMMFNTQWITVTPMISSVPPNSWRDVTVAFDPEILRNGVYHVDMTIHNNSADSSVLLPVALTVALAAEEPPTALPTEYALYQNYPNPFNSETTFKFDLKQAGHTSLKVFNLLGQEVATVADGFLDAGRYDFQFDMNGLASGVFILTLQSGGFNGVGKLVLV